MSFFNWLFGIESQRHREIDAHIIMVNSKLSIEREAEYKFQVVCDKLTNKEKKKIDKTIQVFCRGGFIFPTRGSYLDFKRYLGEDILEVRNR